MQDQGHKIESNISLLKFTTAGSVDDGKSTLIGRLLLDTKSIIKSSNMNLAFLSDGLKSEREQGITIDVAYKYFSTNKRKFIICDCPGHKQYTKNLVTGASHCELAIILIDANKGITEQTKRHFFICNLLGITQFIIAINKMDTIEYVQSIYEKIKHNFLEFASIFNIPSLLFIPISALNGENVSTTSRKMPWYDGPYLLNYLEEIHQNQHYNLVDFRFPVQFIAKNKQDRYYFGQISSGILHNGDKVKVLPSMYELTISKIIYNNKEIEKAFAPMSIALSFEQEIDIERGDMIVKADNFPYVTNHFEADLIWFDNKSSSPKTAYILKHSTKETKVYKKEVLYTININTLKHQNKTVLNINDIGRVIIKTQSDIFIDNYFKNKFNGNFILIDPVNNNTVAAGLIINIISKKKPQKINLTKEKSFINKKAKEKIYNQKAHTYWLTGLSASGKTTIAMDFEKKIFKQNKNIIFLDGDNIRSHLNSDLGFTKKDRNENLRRVAELAKLLNDNGLMVITSFISPFLIQRNLAKKIIGESNVSIIYCNSSLKTCIKRDPKGLYKKALNGEIDNFTGISSSYEVNKEYDLIIDTETQTIEQSCFQLYQYFKKISLRR